MFDKLSKTNEKARQVFFMENNLKEDEPQRSHNIILKEVKINKLMTRTKSLKMKKNAWKMRMS